MGFALALGMLIGGLFLLLWANDVRQDRKHTALVKLPTLAFAGTGSDLCGGSKLTLIQPGTTLRVRRIRYWKNCTTVDVALPDGHVGHIVLGEGEVTIIPSLNAYK